MAHSPNNAWARLENLLVQHLPGMLDDLAPAATEADLDALAHTTNLDLPPFFRSLYLGHDGQEGAAPGLFFGMNFLSVSEAAREWENWTSLIRDTPELLEEISVDSHPDGAVQTVYAHPGWIPIASDGAGNHLAADFAPGPDGVAGQIISFGTDEPVRYVLAPSAMAFLEWCAEQLETGKAVVSPDPNAPGGQVLRVVEAVHLLDALRKRT